MDSKLLVVFLEQVGYGCKAVRLAVSDIQAGLSDPSRSQESTDLVWYGVQNLVVAAGNLSKLLWGSSGNASERARLYEERRPIRESLSVTDESLFRQVDIRNHFEHMDERVTRWWAETDRNRIGAAITPRASLGGTIRDDKRSIFRWLDPKAGDVLFWGDELSIPAALDEANRMLAIVQQRQKDYYRGGAGVAEAPEEPLGDGPDTLNSVREEASDGSDDRAKPSGAVIEIRPDTGQDT